MNTAHSVQEGVLDSAQFDNCTQLGPKPGQMVGIKEDTTPGAVPGPPNGATKGTTFGTVTVSMPTPVSKK